MSHDRLTPEERLLRVIDNPQAAKGHPLARLTRGTSSLGGMMLSVAAALKGSKPGTQPLLTLRMVNRMLVVLGALVTLIWMIDFFSIRSQYVARLEMVERTQLIAPTQTRGTSLPMLEFGQVLEEAAQRNPFTFLPPKAEAQAPAAPVVEDLTPQLDDLKLVGIIWSDNPQAMIEQTKEGKTSLVGKGETIGPFRVKEILKDRVVVGRDSGDQEWELK